MLVHVVTLRDQLLATMSCAVDAAECAKQHPGSTVTACQLNSTVVPSPNAPAPPPCAPCQWQREARFYDDFGGSWVCSGCGNVAYGLHAPRSA